MGPPQTGQDHVGSGGGEAGHGDLAVRTNPEGPIPSLLTDVAMPGAIYDALLHAVFVGFVLSLVFAHAPLIFPAVLGLPLTYRPALYLHVGVLHLSLIARLIGDLVEELGRWRSWGSMGQSAPKRWISSAGM